MFKKILAVALSIAMICVALASCGSNDAAKKGMSEDLLPRPTIEAYTCPADFKIGLICLHDENSTYDLNFINSLKAVKEAYGLTDDQVIIKKGIEEGQACFEAAEALVALGCKVIFADSFGHEDYMIQAAKKYSDVQFCHATGTKAHTAGVPNFHNAFAAIYEGRYIAGIAAGLKLNELKAAGKLKGDHPVIGYVGAFTYAEVMSGYTSFYLGAKSVCPDVTMNVQFTGSWYDESGEKNAAQALLATADLISQHADSLGAPTACEDAGVPNISYNGSTYDYAENTFIMSSAINWAPYFELIIKNTCEGKEIPADYTGTIATGSVVLTGINLDVAAEGTLDAINTAIAGFKAGTLAVYDVTKDNYITVGGQKLTTYMADVDTDDAFTPDTEAIVNGVFTESTLRSAPYFNVRIDGITLVNELY